MSPPLNPHSVHSRVRALLAEPRSTADIAASLGVSVRQVARAVWHLQQRGAVRLVRRRPACVYVIGDVREHNAFSALDAMQAAAREQGRIRREA